MCQTLWSLYALIHVSEVMTFKLCILLSLLPMTRTFSVEIISRSLDHWMWTNLTSHATPADHKINMIRKYVNKKYCYYLQKLLADFYTIHAKQLSRCCVIKTAFSDNCEVNILTFPCSTNSRWATEAALTRAAVAVAIDFAASRICSSKFNDSSACW